MSHASPKPTGSTHPRSILKPYRRPGLFITGTATDIGKTTVTAALAGAFHTLGVRVGICKPIATGCPIRPGLDHRTSPTDDDLLSPDIEISARAAGLGTVDQTLMRAMSPLRYAAPVSPHLAARVEQRPPNWHRVAEAFDFWEDSCDVLLVEGAGGWMVPLDDHDFTIADLATILHLPVIVVTNAQLGTLNYTHLTVSAVRQRGLVVGGLVINRVPAKRDLVISSNLEELPRFCAAPLRAVFAETGDIRSAGVPADFIESLAPFARQWWDLARAKEE